MFNGELWHIGGGNMSVNLGGYIFDGPFVNVESLEDRAGIYTILDKRSDGMLYVIDIGESANVKTRVETHDRATCWYRNSYGVIVYAAYYTPYTQQIGRIRIEQELRLEYEPPCGER